MSAAFTPGPWHASCVDQVEGLERGDNGIRFWSIRTDGAYRGDVAHCFSAEHIGGIKLAERDGNAHLISAAPSFYELAPDALDLLEHYAEFIKTIKSNELERHPYLPSIEATVEGLRSAIAKARGDA